MEIFNTIAIVLSFMCNLGFTYIIYKIIKGGKYEKG